VPPRLTRPAIIRHHRDLGVVLAIPIILAAFTGTLMVLAPLSDAVLRPLSSPAEVAAWKAKPPPAPFASLDWPALLATAQARFPDGELRIIVWPREASNAVQIRLRQPSEWHPNGRSAVWMAGDSPVLMVRNAPAAPLAVRAQQALYPLHASRMAGSAMAMPLRIVLTLAGLGLTMLGSLAVFSFWRARRPAANASVPAAI
jgi:uncharacterized iron-regulated membrane protein